MIEAERSLEIDAPTDQVWSYVEVIPNWAPFMVGFRNLTIVDDRRSIWTLRGDVGVLAREVDIQADITVWEPRRRVEFTLTGLTERITGRGSVELTAVASTGAPDQLRRPTGRRRLGGLRRFGGLRRLGGLRRFGGWRRLRYALAARLLRRLDRRARRPAPGGEPAPAGSAGPAGGLGRGRSRLRFTLQLTPGGPMAPMVELLMTPMLEPAAQDFLQRLREALERRSTVPDQREGERP